MATAMGSCSSYASTALHRSSAFSNSRPPASSGTFVTRFRQKQRLKSSFSATKLVSHNFLQRGCGFRVGGDAFVPGVVVAAAAGAGSSLPEALLFDCDGVLVDTERDGHRISFNIAFSEVRRSPLPRGSIERSVLDIRKGLPVRLVAR